MPYSLSRLSIWTIIAALPLTFLSQLPDAKYDWVLMVTGTIFLACRQQWLKEGAILLLLFLWMITPGRELVRQIHFLSARPLEATVIIDQVQPLTERMRVRIVQAAEQPFFSPIYAQLSLKNIPQKFCGGQRWKMRLRLRPVHARLNEGGFDSQRFALANSMPLTGKILSMQPVNSSCGWREKIIESRRQKYDGLPWQAVISALAFGDRGEMSTEIKTLLRETGTAHLIGDIRHAYRPGSQSGLAYNTTITTVFSCALDRLSLTSGRKPGNGADLQLDVRWQRACNAGNSGAHYLEFATAEWAMLYKLAGLGTLHCGHRVFRSAEYAFRQPLAVGSRGSGSAILVSMVSIASTLYGKKTLVTTAPAAFTDRTFFAAHAGANNDISWYQPERAAG